METVESNSEGVPLVSSQQGGLSLDQSQSSLETRGRRKSLPRRNKKSAFDISLTTAVGLLLVFAMIAITVTSLCLQRYSANTYIDIIVPTNATSTNITVPTL
ncbi:hypothetical protein Ocin01_06995 [Orchesella cincta]|uniref:Uncharacterized protein n=1 Tax=Orchesella cincta TaxID=48709 RepID=A0A1D2N3N5_ORCCI|nr:hypothetical protein Ocin01_06995 [Orchesella cincta]